MKAAVFKGIHSVVVEEVPTPKISPWEVLIQVKACGVCGTDVHIFSGDKGAADTTPPVILGHEFSGVVSAVGEAVTQFQPGDRVCVDPNFYCGKCQYCRDGLAHFCTQMVGYGTTQNGGFAEYCAVDQRQVYPLGENTSFAQGAMAEPLACCIHGIDLCEIVPGSQVVIIGGGMVGLLMLQLAQLKGAAKIALLEPEAAKRETALRLGADVCIDPKSQDPAAIIARHGMNQVDVVIECVGNVHTIRQAISLAGKKSTVMMFGLTKPDDELAIRPFALFQSEITLKSSFINPYTQRRALELIESGKVDVSAMVARTAGLGELSDILANPAMRTQGKCLIDPGI